MSDPDPDNDPTRTAPPDHDPTRSKSIPDPAASPRLDGTQAAPPEQNRWAAAAGAVTRGK